MHAGLGVKDERGSVPGGAGGVVTLSRLSRLRPAEGSRRPWRRPQGTPVPAWTVDWRGEDGDPAPSLPEPSSPSLPGPPLLCSVTLVHVPSPAPDCGQDTPADPAVQVPALENKAVHGLRTMLRVLAQRVLVIVTSSSRFCTPAVGTGGHVTRPGHWGAGRASHSPSAPRASGRAPQVSSDQRGPLSQLSSLLCQGRSRLRAGGFPESVVGRHF